MRAGHRGGTCDAEVTADAANAAVPVVLPTGRARFFDPQDGQLDLSYFLEDPRGFLQLPIVFTEPAVAFGGAGRTWTERANRSFQQSVGSGGAGFRYELARKFDLNAGIDVAVSPGTTAVYFVIGNAWFRP